MGRGYGPTQMTHGTQPKPNTMTAVCPRRVGEREGTGYWDRKPREPFLMTMRRGHMSAKPQGAQTSVYVTYLQTETKSYTTLSMIGLYTGLASRWITTLLSAFGPKARGSLKRCRWSKRGLLRAYWYSTGITCYPLRGATIVPSWRYSSGPSLRAMPNVLRRLLKGTVWCSWLVRMLGGAEHKTGNIKRGRVRGRGSKKKGV